MLCDSGVPAATPLITSGTLPMATFVSSTLAAFAGSSAATSALTTAMPSRLFAGAALDSTSTAVALELLMPPMQTVGMEAWPADERAERMERMPDVPMMDFVSFLL